MTRYRITGTIGAPWEDQVEHSTTGEYADEPTLDQAVMLLAKRRAHEHLVIRESVKIERLDDFGEKVIEQFGDDLEMLADDD